MPKACYSHAVTNLQVKDVPAQMHDELRRRARERGVSVRDYVLDLLRRDQAVPTKAEWSARLERLPPVTVEPPAAELLRDERALRPGRPDR